MNQSIQKNTYHWINVIKEQKQKSEKYFFLNYCYIPTLQKSFMVKKVELNHDPTAIPFAVLINYAFLMLDMTKINFLPRGYFNQQCINSV